MGDSRLRRLVVAHALAVTAEWVVVVGLLVHAFSWGGAGAVGIVSIAVASRADGANSEAGYPGGYT